MNKTDNPIASMMSTHARSVMNAVRNANSPNAADESRFCPVSLGDWLRLCGEIGIPYVPARNVTQIDKDDYLNFETPGEHRERLSTALRAIHDAAQSESQKRTMMRFDPCSPMTVKYALSVGSYEWKPEFEELILDDPRAFDILYEYPRQSIPIWQRPWIATQIEDGYPVEYRAFVRDGRVVGVSNYYPQRPLKRQHFQIQRVFEYTARLAEKAPAPFLWHRPIFGIPNSPDPEGIHFTADFIVDQDGRTLFLEGGPPHGLGAHPCCFRPDDVRGVALSDRNAEETPRPSSGEEIPSKFAEL